MRRKKKQKIITNLTDADVHAVVEILDSWSQREKLTWEALVVQIERLLHKSWSRQALSRHLQISDAFRLRKNALRTSGPAHVEEVDEDIPPDLKTALAHADKLKAENQRLATQNTQLLEQFAQWSYNAEAAGMVHVLFRPLPTINRRTTRDDYKPVRPTDRPRVRPKGKKVS